MSGESGVITATMLSMQDQCNIQNFCFQFVADLNFGSKIYARLIGEFASCDDAFGFASSDAENDFVFLDTDNLTGNSLSCT